MSSRTGVRPTGTDGTDFHHRQRVAPQYQYSVQYKFYLKCLYVLHVLVLIAMWLKVGGEVAHRDFGFHSELLDRLDLPSAYPWEYVWCFSGVPIVLGLASFSRNKVNLINLHYYGQFFTGIVPVALGLGSQLPELVDYIQHQENSNTPTFKGHFPMVILWYIFFLLALQIHSFAMYCSYQLAAAWTPVSKND